MRWWTTIRKQSPPFSLIAQQHTIAELEQDLAKQKSNAWIWSMAWPEVELPGQGVRIRGKRYRVYRRGKGVPEAGFTNVIERSTVRPRDLWYDLLIAHMQQKDPIATNGKIKRFFYAIAHPDAAGQGHAAEAGETWDRHVQMIQTARTLDDADYYQHAVNTIKQAEEIGVHIASMLEKTDGKKTRT
jgi:hypothetical protein